MQRVALLLALALAAPAAADPVRYTLDGRHSNVRFSYDYGGLAAQVVAMHGPSAELTFDADDPAAIRLVAEVPVTGVSTGLPNFDTKFASAEYFDAAKAPQVRFTSRSVRRLGDGRYAVDGVLALRGIEQPVTLTATLGGQDAEAIGFSGRFTVKRSAFGLGMYTESIGDEVTVDINAIFKRASG